LKLGDELEAVVLTLDREERKMSLGIKQLTEDPWTKPELINKYAVGTKHKGTIRNLTNFGLFIELEEGIDGLVHVSDLSWTKKIKHPSEFVKVGDTLEVVVLELDVENKRLALSHKHIEENPWDAFESVFAVGSQHKGTINSKNERGALIELPYGIEGFASSKHLVKEDGTIADVGETLYFVVLEFAKDEKKIILSHTKSYQNKKEQAETTEASTPVEGKKTSAKKEKEVAKQEKDTLGDNDVLAALKESLESNEAPSKPSKKASKA
jgi:small subunit ribosomal protein S1